MLKNSILECSICKKRAVSAKDFKARHGDECPKEAWKGMSLSPPSWGTDAKRPHNLARTKRPAQIKEYRHKLKDRLRLHLLANGFIPQGGDSFRMSCPRHQVTYILGEKKFELQDVELPLKEGWSFTFHPYTKKTIEHICTLRR